MRGRAVQIFIKKKKKIDFIIMNINDLVVKLNQAGYMVTQSRTVEQE